MKIDSIQLAHNIYGKKALHPVKQPQTTFSQVMENLKAQAAFTDTVQETSVPLTATHLPGDYLSSFAVLNPSESDLKASPKGLGAHAHQASDTTIDKTSPLYQQSLELESFFVKIMLDSMRTSLGTTSLTGKDSFAGKMYEDMMYEELSRTVTKNAGLGLADQIYLQLKDGNQS